MVRYPLTRRSDWKPPSMRDCLSFYQMPVHEGPTHFTYSRYRSEALATIFSSAVSYIECRHCKPPNIHTFFTYTSRFILTASTQSNIPGLFNSRTCQYHSSRNEKKRSVSRRRQHCDIDRLYCVGGAIPQVTSTHTPSSSHFLHKTEPLD